VRGPVYDSNHVREHGGRRLPVQDGLQEKVLGLVSASVVVQEFLLLRIAQEQEVGKIVQEVIDLLQRPAGLAGNLRRAMCPIQEVQDRYILSGQLEDLATDGIVERHALRCFEGYLHFWAQQWQFQWHCLSARLAGRGEAAHVPLLRPQDGLRPASHDQRQV